MNLSATLTPSELEALSNYEKQVLLEAGQILERTTSSGSSEESAFEKSLRIKNTLDSLEETAGTESSWHVLAILVNCEYQLWHLNANTPLNHNPFLSHWVEAVQRLDKPGRQGEGGSTGPSTEKVTATRVLWIKTLLRQKNLKRWEDYTPLEVYDWLAKNGPSESFDLRPYIRMLEDEGIYEKSPNSKADTFPSSGHPEVQAHNDDGPTMLKKTEQSSEDALQKKKDRILHTLQEQPDTAIFDITRLPIAIPYLDFLTTLLADRTLEKLSIDSAPIITQYIQHALRTVEQAEKPPSPPPELETATEGWVDDRAEVDTVEYGKEAQTRYIRLLLLFIKSLIRKGLVELDVLYYEIAEITVRYVWIKEVREFRTWAEEGIEEDGGG